jgi:cell division protein FtsW
MAEQSLPPQFVDEPVAQPIRPATPARGTAVLPNTGPSRPAERTISFWASIDKPQIILTAILLVVGIMMVFSTTFDWSTSDYGDPTVIVMGHVRNALYGLVAAAGALIFGYKRLRRFVVPILLVAIAFLVAVQLFGSDTFNARRTLVAGRFAPGEAAELAMIIYMAAWMEAKNTRISSLTYGLIPFALILGFVVGLVVLQPDLSTAITIAVVCCAMFFLAGADLMQLAALGAIATGGGVLVISSGIVDYAGGRFMEFLSGWSDPTQLGYQIQGARIAFDNGGWTGVGLGQSLQKFTGLPAPHTDSIFAVIGEELGIIGAGIVVLLYVLFILRGFYISRRAADPFGALLAAGITIWVATKALLNIAVMLALVPPTGVTLPFISYGGSSLVTLLVGVGLLLSVQRVSLLRESQGKRRSDVTADLTRSRGDRRSRIPGTGGR